MVLYGTELASMYTDSGLARYIKDSISFSLSPILFLFLSHSLAFTDVNLSAISSRRRRDKPRTERTQMDTGISN